MSCTETGAWQCHQQHGVKGGAAHCPFPLSLSWPQYSWLGELLGALNHPTLTIRCHPASLLPPPSYRNGCPLQAASCQASWWMRCSLHLPADPPISVQGLHAASWWWRWTTSTHQPPVTTQGSSLLLFDPTFAGLPAG